MILPILLALCAGALAAPSAAITGNASLVYSFYASHCPPLPQAGCSLDIAEGCDCDIADAPMRFFRRSGGDNATFSLASVDLGSRAMVGQSPLAHPNHFIRQRCARDTSCETRLATSSSTRSLMSSRTDCIVVRSSTNKSLSSLLHAFSFITT